MFPSQTARRIPPTTPTTPPPIHPPARPARAYKPARGLPTYSTSHRPTPTPPRPHRLAAARIIAEKLRGKRFYTELPPGFFARRRRQGNQPFLFPI